MAARLRGLKWLIYIANGKMLALCLTMSDERYRTLLCEHYLDGAVWVFLLEERIASVGLETMR